MHTDTSLFLVYGLKPPIVSPGIIRPYTKGPE